MSARASSTGPSPFCRLPPFLALALLACSTASLSDILRTFNPRFCIINAMERRWFLILVIMVVIFGVILIIAYRAGSQGSTANLKPTTSPATLAGQASRATTPTIPRESDAAKPASVEPTTTLPGFVVCSSVDDCTEKGLSTLNFTFCRDIPRDTPEHQKGQSDCWQAVAKASRDEDVMSGVRG